MRIEEKYLFSLSDLTQLATKLCDDFCAAVNNDTYFTKKAYKIHSSEPKSLTRQARISALASIKPNNFVKKAFDTRNIDQEKTRNPRENLQYWHRTDPFLDPEVEEKVKIFARLIEPLEDIKSQFGDQQDYFSSYSRVLYENVNRILRVKEADMDIFKPQINYLEQLLFNRYRLTEEDIKCFSKESLKERILLKDEDMVKRAKIVGVTSVAKQEQTIVKDGRTDLTQQSIVNAIFGQQFRQPGEKTVERTITITIRDNVVE